MIPTLPSGTLEVLVGVKRVRGQRPTTIAMGHYHDQKVAGSDAGPSPLVDQEARPEVDDAFKRWVASHGTKHFATREPWLEAAADELGRSVFFPAGHPLPQVKVTIGFPSEKGVSKERRALGQCWAREASEDGLNQIFLNPTLTSAEKIVDVLVHELVHAVDNCKSGHKGEFWKICKAIGLTEGTPATASADLVLKAVIATICHDLGPLPHATLNALGEEKKQSTRLLKVECPACGYTCRIAAKWIEYGLPICPCGSLMATAQISATKTHMHDVPGATAAELSKSPE